MIKTNLEMIREIGTEILDYVDPSRLVDPHIYGEMQESDTEDALHKLFLHANIIPTAFRQQGAGAEDRSSLVSKMLEFRSKPDAVSSVHASLGGTCFQAELRFARSIARHMKRRTPARNRLPSAILRDMNGAPFAYQKADGHPTAFAWHSGRVATSTGSRWVPQGSIVELVYEGLHNRGVYQGDPRHNYPGESLIVLQDATALSDVRLKRVGVEYSPHQLRIVAVDLAIKDVHSLAAYKQPAIEWSSRRLGEVAHELLSLARVSRD